MEDKMLLDGTPQYNAVWDKVYDELHFKPGMKESVPFVLEMPHCVYDISRMIGERLEVLCDELEDISKEIFAKVTPEGSRVYALDWQHSCFLYNPRNPDEQKDFWQENARYMGGGYNVYFPTFFPDGDYYFFIAEDFSYGYLGHPWRQEVWIFGEPLIAEYEAIYKKFDWRKK